MEVEFMTADTALPPCMPLPRAMLRLPISSTAKVMYARMLDIVFLSGIEDANGILFIHFPIVELAAALARSTMTVKRSLNELEDAGLILRVRQGFGEPNKIFPWRSSPWCSSGSGTALRDKVSRSPRTAERRKIEDETLSGDGGGAVCRRSFMRI